MASPTMSWSFPSLHLSPEETEPAKLFTNTWRSIKFAAVNQFSTMGDDRGLDFSHQIGRGSPPRWRTARSEPSRAPLIVKYHEPSRLVGPRRRNIPPGTDQAEGGARR